MKTVLKMENIVKRFGDREILKGVSLTLKEGDVTAVIGPSGGGKSTLLRVAALLERADGGSISYNELMAAEDTPQGTSYVNKALLRACTLRFGMVFQSFELFPHRSVLQNVCDAPVFVKKTPREQAEESGLQLLSSVGLKDRAMNYPYQLSGGEKQRVCIARALAMEPEMLFFDEPTSALDPESTRGVLEIIRDLANMGMTMLVVTHEMAFARAVADKMIFLEDGVIVEEGCAKLLDNPKSARARAFLTSGLSYATV
ncbi:MAG TPA: amino acid ABC transporter ATP-binding protein [Clostridia bacterium]|nr:amino acid ABC transporter ATP-binding protein [Clostridia bacterium]